MELIICSSAWVKHKEPLSPLESEKPEHEATFWSEKKKNWMGKSLSNFSQVILDAEMTSASYRRERSKNKAALRKADNLFNLFTTCPSSRTG